MQAREQFNYLEGLQAGPRLACPLQSPSPALALQLGNGGVQRVSVVLQTRRGARQPLETLCSADARSSAPQMPLRQQVGECAPAHPPPSPTWNSSSWSVMLMPSRRFRKRVTLSLDFCRGGRGVSGGTHPWVDIRCTGARAPTAGRYGLVSTALGRRPRPPHCGSHPAHLCRHADAL